MQDEKTYKIIGAAMEVHRELGCGFLEPVYQETLAKEFDSQNIPYRPQPIVKIFYKGCGKTSVQRLLNIKDL